MLSERTEILKSFDGTDILFRVFSPQKRERRSTPRGLILAVHDFGEHSGRYAELAADLCKNNLALASFDLRGHGKSGPRRGDAENFQAMVADIIFMMNHSRSFLSMDSSKNAFFGVFGLGFGALLAAYASSILGASCPPLMLASPLFFSQQKVPVWKRLVALSLPRIAPIAKLPLNFIAETVATSKNTVSPSDSLALPSITSRMEEILLQSLNDFRVRNALAQMESPTTILCGSLDSIVDVSRVQDFVPSLGSRDSSFQILENTPHDIISSESPTRAQVIENILKWASNQGAAL
jgi:acylglycerol lipase